MYARIGTLDVTNERSGTAEHGLARGLERAALACGLGLPFNPEIGLFAGYGDVLTYQQQPDFADHPDLIPPTGAWLELSLEEMASRIQAYAARTAQRILDTGVVVGTWNLGNEVDSGICGITPPSPRDPATPGSTDSIDPEIGRINRFDLVLRTSEPDRIRWLSAHIWPLVGRLLAAAAAGVREVDPRARFSTHIAAANPESTAAWTEFWDVVADAGYLPDVFGTSMYPSGPVEHHPDDLHILVGEAAQLLRERWGRPTFIAEYAYPIADVIGPFPFGREVRGYPRAESGQAAYLSDLAARGRSEGWLEGIRPWAPDLVTGHWGPLSLFHLDGSVARANLALSVFDA
ncbi:glycosyl hydrolase 53 family protein [Microbacterium jejuense]|uniref:glycosyl hydrolase 53 family protein n=1 Tax=Microbacterium jejuense TaxID=1263637 RepID=UPI0031E88CDE